MTPAGHYADADTTGTAPTSGNTPVGHITPPSALCRLCGVPHKRHTFAVTTLIGWYRDGVDVAARLPWLSTYLGHRDPRSTYWYLSATPELLAIAAARLEPMIGKVLPR